MQSTTTNGPVLLIGSSSTGCWQLESTYMYIMTSIAIYVVTSMANLKINWLSYSLNLVQATYVNTLSKTIE